MATLIQVIKHVCMRPAMMCPDAKSASDLCAFIRGLCTGAAGVNEGIFLATFPRLVVNSLQADSADDWHDALLRHFATRKLQDMCVFMCGLIDEWSPTAPSLPEVRSPEGPSRPAIDAKTFAFIEATFRDVHHTTSWARTLREILNYIRGLLSGRFPPHGYVAGEEHLHAYICHHLDKPEIRRMEIVLLESFQAIPVEIACSRIADLIRSWLGHIPTGRG